MKLYVVDLFEKIEGKVFIKEDFIEVFSLYKRVFKKAQLLVNKIKNYLKNK